MFTWFPLAAQTSWKAQRCHRLATASEPAVPVAVIDDVVLDGVTDVAEPIWKRIVSQIQGETFYGNAWVDELRDVYLLGALQNQGYLKAELTVDTELVSSSPALQHVVVHARVKGGTRYRLASVQFVSSEKHVAFSAQELRPLIPLHDGDIFSVAKVREGLEALSRYYGSHGYVDFVAAPTTNFDEMNQQIALVLSLQEGFEWRVGNIEIVGLNPVLESDFRSKIKTGDILHSQLIDDFYQDHKSELPEKVGPEDTQFHFNVKERTADALFDFRSCSQVEN